jgi:hypothetical protein
VDELRRATGIPSITLSHLRHSFASYLLATLMLPIDVDAEAVPNSLRSVISPARFARVADRLLGRARLGAGAVHAVSQVMGHTNTGTTLRYYCHLMDLSLGIYCNRTSSLPKVDPAWLVNRLGVSADARRKAASRIVAPARILTLQGLHVRPSADELRQWTPNMPRRDADAKLLAAGFKRLSRPIARNIAAAVDAERTPASATVGDTPPPRRRQRAPETVYQVHWRAVVAVANAPIEEQRTSGQDADVDRWRSAAEWMVPRHWLKDGRLPAPATPQLCRYVDQHLLLSRPVRRREVIALREIVYRWRAGNSDIRLPRLTDAAAFVGLLAIMGFAEDEVDLSLTSLRARGMTSRDIHRFLGDRRSAPHLKGRSGWRGALVVKVRPKNLDQPILTAYATRLALLTLAIDTDNG